MRILIVGSNIFDTKVSSGLTQIKLFGAIDMREVAVIDLESSCKFKMAGEGKLLFGKTSDAVKRLMPVKLRNELRPVATVFKRHHIEDIVSDISKFEPTVIYSMLGDIPTILAVLAIKRVVPNAKICIHIMDNWMMHPYPGTMLGALNGIFLDYYFRRLLKATSKVLCISKDMCDYVSEKYSVLTNEYFMNSVDQAWFSSAIRSQHRYHTRIIYFGGLHLSRDSTLLKLCDKINGSETRKHIEMCVYTLTRSKEIETRFEKFSFVKFFDAVSSSDLPCVSADFDILLHLEAFSDESVKYSQFSLSTKLPELLASGKKIVAFGSRRNGTIRFLKNSGFGVVIDEIEIIDVNLLCEKLRLVSLDALQSQRRYAMNNFHTQNQAVKFRDVLVEMSY